MNEYAVRLAKLTRVNTDLLATLEAWTLWFRQGKKAPLYRSEQVIKEARRLQALGIEGG